ncbi:hypothetical protein [Streptomyces exfoliatus]|uniref:hypothetical protein n=1 Tax=Streptomyces exfoliatus TaxID=1905 RepID=UPI0004CA8E4C|nr:hypothetical protein [Streptomyces exfoliatus]
MTLVPPAPVPHPLTDPTDETTDVTPVPDLIANLDPGPEPEPAQEPAQEQEPTQEPDQAPEPQSGPRVRPVPLTPPAGSRGDAEDRPPRPSGIPPRVGTVTVPEPSRAAQARRRGVPSVRAVRLTDEPPVLPDRPATAPAAVTPVPLPLPRTVTPAEQTPTESRTEEPQP